VGGGPRTTRLHTAHPFSLGRFRNTEALFEGQFAWEDLPDGGCQVENARGRSGHGCPFFVLRNNTTGEGAIGHLEYSGDWQMAFYNDHEPAMRPEPSARLYARIGLAGAAPLRVLAPGEVARTPAVHRRYRVTYGNTGQSFDAEGHALASGGLTARVPGVLQSELLLFEALGR
jgi:hypothetical protein